MANDKVEEKFKTVGNGKIKFIDYLSNNFFNTKYAIILSIIIILLLFFILHYSSILFIYALMFLLLACAFDFFNILDSIKQNNYKYFEIVKNCGFVYIITPFVSILFIFYKMNKDFAFWIISLIIFNKIISYLVDDVLKIDLFSTKLYGERSILSIVNNLLFVMIFSSLFGYFLKQNIFIFIIINIMITSIIFLEEYLINLIKTSLQIVEIKYNILSKLYGFALPTFFVCLLKILHLLSGYSK